MTAYGPAPVCAACIDSIEPWKPGPRCGVCGRGFPSEIAVADEGVCAACRREPPAYDRAAGYGPYEGALRRIVHLLKYDGMQPLARPLGERLAEKFQEIERPDLIIPVPLHWIRNRQRGFNQSGLLAQELSRRVGVERVPDVLRRKRATAPQMRRSRAERMRNLRGAFEVVGKEHIAGRKVLLVDDVMTTGATIDACARALKRAGASRVSALTAARAELEGLVH